MGHNTTWTYLTQSSRQAVTVISILLSGGISPSFGDTLYTDFGRTYGKGKNKVSNPIQKGLLIRISKIKNDTKSDRHVCRAFIKCVANHYTKQKKNNNIFLHCIST